MVVLTPLKEKFSSAIQKKKERYLKFKKDQDKKLFKRMSDYYKLGYSEKDIDNIVESGHISIIQKFYHKHKDKFTKKPPQLPPKQIQFPMPMIPPEVSLTEEESKKNMMQALAKMMSMFGNTNNQN